MALKLFENGVKFKFAALPQNFMLNLGIAPIISRCPALGVFKRDCCVYPALLATAPYCLTLHWHAFTALTQRLDAPGCLLFRDAARAALPLDYPWTKRVRHAYLLLPESFPSAPSLNRYLCCHVRSQASVAWECALLPTPLPTTSLPAAVSAATALPSI
jgi:hypothetical protein